MSDFLADAFPALASRLPRLQLADLPTPVEQETLLIGGSAYDVAVKHDDVTGKIYGGNKVRKLEYLFAEAQQRQSNCIATFGTVASNHALATSLYAQEIGYPCICFLSHQARTPGAARALNMHLKIGTQIVRYNWTSEDRHQLVQEALSSYRAFLIPPGGSSPLGAAGFVNAGLELAAQIESGETRLPSRIYVANGTMGTAVGLTLGLALAGVDTEVHAVQVTEDMVSSPDAMQKLLRQTAIDLGRADESIPADLADRARYQFRSGFLGDGYARTNDATEAAIAVARDELGIELEATYTGKAMAALLSDLRGELVSGPVLFWNTYNSRPLSTGTAMPENTDGLPEEFLRYFD
jgi:1-aminocyclopropane-1-carboxylate deaminase/D-cysteine desulfhydrase-like pyridoxal-dependent ACC family enzyme